MQPAIKQRVDLWHVALCQNVGAEFRGRAHGDALGAPSPTSAAQIADPHLRRADAWLDLARRLKNAFNGAQAHIYTRDVDLVGFYSRSLFRSTYGPGVRDRARNIERLTAFLMDAVNGRVENVVGVKVA